MRGGSQQWHWEIKMAPVFNPTSEKNGTEALTNAFVGRATELETVRAASEKVRSGTGQVVLVAGPPGIGKTKLAERAAAESAERGAAVLWGRCWEGGGAPAYWPWTQVIRQCFAILDSHQHIKLDSPAARYVASVFVADDEEKPPARGPRAIAPEELTVISSRATEGEEQARFRLFDSVAIFLKQLAGELPLTVVLDDLHVADADSLLLLRFLARDLRNFRTFLIGTFREIEAKLTSLGAELLSDIGREGQVISLRGFTRTEVEQFMRTYSHGPPDSTLVTDLLRTTEGNPLFLKTVVELMDAEDWKEHRPRSLRTFQLPNGLGATIRKSISPLSAKCKSILEVASVIGTGFDFSILQKVTKELENELLDELDKARRAGIVTEDDDKPGRFSFLHSTIRDTLVADQPRATLRRLHKEIAEVIEESYASNVEAYLAELAYHYFEAIPAGTSEKAIGYAARGAERALGKLAYEEAVRLYTMALVATAAGSGVGQQRRCELLLALGKAQSKAGLIKDSRDSFLEAADAAREIGRVDLLALAAIGATAEWGIPGTVIQRQVDLLQEALDEQGLQETTLRSLLLARLANEYFWSEDREMASKLAEQALEVGRLAADPIALASAIWTRTATLWSPDNVDERLAGANEIVRLAERAASLEWNLKGRDLRLVTLLELGEVRRIDREVEEYASILRESGLSSPRPDKFRAMRALMSSDIDRAEEFARRAFAIGNARQDPGATIAYEAQLTNIRTIQGRLAEMEPLLRRRVVEFPTLVVMRCGLAACYANLERTQEAQVEFEILAANDFRAIPRDWNWLGAVTMAATTCAFLNDVARAEVLYQMILPYAERNVTVGWGEVSYGSASHVLGALASVTEQFEMAEEHLRKAVAANLRMGARGFAANSQCELAKMLLKRGGRDDREKAVELCDSAVRTATDLRLDALADFSARVARGLVQPSGDEESLDSPIIASSIVERNALRNEGDFWLIRFESKEYRIRNVKGLTYLARLLKHPGVEFHGLELAAYEAGGGQGAYSEPEALNRFEFGDAGPMIDQEAKASYHRRVIELREELEEAQDHGDPDRAERIREEIDLIARELSRAVGIGGRDRRASSASERARLSITRSVRVAIEKISKVCPDLGKKLSASVKTGTYFCYTIDPKGPILWEA